jgi:acetyltransferase-like isoleucine patch superfamily enzyme
MTRIESTAIIEDGAEIGENCYIGHFAVIRPGVIIGDYSEVRAHTFVAAKAIIGRGTNVNQFTNICRDTVIEDNVFIGPGVIMTNTRKIAFKRDYNDLSQAPYIEYGARIGGGVTICPNVRIGKNCMIGAGSVVTKSTESGWVYYGYPAEKIRVVPKDELL